MILDGFDVGVLFSLEGFFVQDGGWGSGRVGAEIQNKGPPPG